MRMWLSDEPFPVALVCAERRFSPEFVPLQYVHFLHRVLMMEKRK